MKQSLLEAKELPYGIRQAFQYTMVGEKENSFVLAKKHWKESQSVEEFEERILTDERMIYNRGFAVLSKLNKPKHFKRLRTMIDPFMSGKYDTPKGVMKLEINDAPVLIPNGGNGSNSMVTRLAIIPETVLWNSNMLPSYITVIGRIKVYDQDESIIANLDYGRYEISHGYSFVIINILPNSSISEEKKL